MTPEDVRAQLTPEAIELFREMVVIHVAASGDRMFIRTDTFGGTGLAFTGDGARSDLSGFDGGALDDLVDTRLLRRGFSARGTVNYRITGTGLAFHQWLLEQEGTALDQLHGAVQRFVAGDEFASKHPSAAHHLGEANALLWTGDTSDRVVSEIGDHLRKAVMDLTTDLVGPGAPGEQERPIPRLRSWLGRAGNNSRENAVLTQLVELTEAVLKLDHRLNHVRDEADQGRPTPTWNEVRRAVFVTCMACFELTH